MNFIPNSQLLSDIFRYMENPQTLVNLLKKIYRFIEWVKTEDVPVKTLR